MPHFGLVGVPKLVPQIHGGGKHLVSSYSRLVLGTDFECERCTTRLHAFLQAPIKTLVSSVLLSLLAQVPLRCNLIFQLHHFVVVKWCSGFLFYAMFIAPRSKNFIDELFAPICVHSFGVFPLGFKVSQIVLDYLSCLILSF